MPLLFLEKTVRLILYEGLKMMNYLAKYCIAQCTFPIKNSSTFKDITFIGIFELTQQGIFETDFSQMDVAPYIKRAICIESRLGGGAGFPIRERVYKIMSDNHADLINAFLDTIPEKKIVLFDDGERYASEMMRLIIRLAQKKGKHITCINVKPMEFRSPKSLKELYSCWEEIKLEVDKSILFNFPPIETEFETIREFHIFKHNEILKHVYKIWKKVNTQR